jgi:hypothetical protein
MSNATNAKNVIEQDDQTICGLADHCGYCTRQNDRAKISTDRVTYGKLDHLQILIEQDDRVKTHFFDHNTVPLEGRGLIEQVDGSRMTFIRRPGFKVIPRPPGISISPVWFMRSLAASARVSKSNVPGGRFVSAPSSPRPVRRPATAAPTSVRQRSVSRSHSIQSPQQDLMGGPFLNSALSLTGPDRRVFPIVAQGFSPCL